MVVYLPIAFLKDWLHKYLNRHSSKSGKGSGKTTEPSDGFASPRNLKIVEMELQGTLTKKDSDLSLSIEDEDEPLVPRSKDDLNVLKVNKELSNRQVATYGFYIAPIWFVTEVSFLSFWTES